MLTEQPASDPQTRGVSYLYMAAAFVVVVAGMRAAEAVLNPLLMAIFLSIISAPAYFRLLSRGVSEWLSLLTVMAVLSVILFGVVFFVTSSIAGFTSQQEYYIERLDEKEKSLKALADSWMPEWAKEAADLNDEDSASEDSEFDLDSEFASNETPSVLDADESSTGSTKAAPDESDAPLTADNVGDVAGSTTVIGDERPIDSEVDDSEQESDGDSLKSVSDIRRRPNRPVGSSMWRVAEDPMPENEQSWTEEVFGQFDPGTVIRLATTVVQSLGLLLSKTLLVLLMVVFILLEAPRFTRKINEAFVRTEEATERATRIIKSVQNYIVIKTWVSLATGAIIAIWLNFIGISHAPLWGLLAFLFNYIPNVGSFIAAIPAVLIAWLELGFLPAFACVFGYVAVNGILGNFVEPRMMGKSLGLSPLVVFCCMLFWGWVLGPVGMLLSVPLTMTARIAMDGFEDTRWLAALMGNTE